MYPQSVLLNEATEQNQGGGESSQQQQFDPNKFREEFRKEIVGELDKRVNGINKEFKTHTTKITSEIGTLRGQLETWLKPKEEQQSEEHGEENTEEHQRQEQERQQAQRSKQGANGNQAGEQQERQLRQQQAPKKDPQVLALERQIKELQDRDKQREAETEKRSKEAERKEIDALARTAISNHKFNSDQGPADLFSLVRNQITRGDDGNLYGSEGMTLEEYIASEYTKRPFLHPARNVNGSGAGQSHGGSTFSGKAFDRDQIRPGMTAEEIAEAGKAISSALGGRR